MSDVAFSRAALEDAAVSGPISSEEIQVSSISRSELATKLERKDSFVLLEALPERYYRHSHLPGAQWLPPDRVSELAPVLIPDPATEVVVYCASATCRNSHQAAAELQRLGYGRVRVYVGGKADWQSASLALERS